jgi:hypothetical protein
MPIEIKIPEADLKGLSKPARGSLKKAVSTYASDVIEEANRIEAGRGSLGAAPEVTRGMIDDAVLVYRRGLGAPRRSKAWKAFRVAAAILSLLVGVLWNTAKLQSDGIYLIIFVIVLAGAILAVTVSTLKE